ncbi:MAG: hypothetical protein OEU09_06730 [Rhodospirillales bacterium]|nr:hypothetical protein [Rhodospirillales bacterium]MDH3792048.1 hypothetical protein [Rhodospirillales bacterium]MDH3910976.1 hypothetical protein [Rhodospirillales bacterium]MDH3919911.1 hypothetical protein [Rhodospirillales bacterium]MDH3968279.1 hypothetical protein [Rhodospirillales bacterium]
MKRDPDHPIIDDPWTYDILGFNYQVDKEDPGKSFIDLTLEKEGVVRRLRFHGPTNLEIEAGFPIPTRGMAILDVRARQLEGIGVEVSDFENSTGSVTFLARAVVDLDTQE